MPGPELPAIELTGEERLALETLVRRRTAGHRSLQQDASVLRRPDSAHYPTVKSVRPKCTSGSRCISLKVRCERHTVW